MDYYYLFPISRNPASPDPDWLAAARTSLMCKGCGSLPRTGKIPDVVVQRVPDKSTMNIVYGVHICFAVTPFLDALCQGEVSHFFYLGKVIDVEKGEAPGVKTFMCPRTILVRGNEKSTFRICADCGHIVYSAIGRRYVLKPEVDGVIIAEDQGGSLVVNETVAERIRGVNWKNLGFKMLELRDEPVDGLDIPSSPPDQVLPA